MENGIDIGMNIKRARLAKGLKQKELAEKLDMTIAALSNFELGIRKPGINTLISIAKVLDISASELIEEEYIGCYNNNNNPLNEYSTDELLREVYKRIKN